MSRDSDDFQAIVSAMGTPAQFCDELDAIAAAQNCLERAQLRAGRTPAKTNKANDQPGRSKGEEDGNFV